MLMAQQKISAVVTNGIINNIGAVSKITPIKKAFIV